MSRHLDCSVDVFVAYIIKWWCLDVYTVGISQQRWNKPIPIKKKTKQKNNETNLVVFGDLKQ